MANEKRNWLSSSSGQSAECTMISSRLGMHPEHNLFVALSLIEVAQPRWISDFPEDLGATIAFSRNFIFLWPFSSISSTPMAFDSPIMGRCVTWRTSLSYLMNSRREVMKVSISVPHLEIRNSKSKCLWDMEQSIEKLIERSTWNHLTSWRRQLHELFSLTKTRRLDSTGVLTQTRQ